MTVMTRPDPTSTPSAQEHLAARHAVLDTVIGPLTVVRDDVGVTGIYFPGHWTRPDALAWGPEVAPGSAGHEADFREVATQLTDYLAGERTEFSVPLSLRGTPFQQAVWARLRQIPFGEVTTYGAISVDLGTAQAHPRAVGHAVGHNPVSILVPCHRVVGSTGQLTGYAGGLERKQHLLTLEGALPEGATRWTRADASGAPTLF